MDIFETIVIAIVEGLTEFLPVSSTGHMIIAQNLLGVESTEFVKAFTFIIQFGAILSVVVLYWKRFFQLNHTPAPEGPMEFRSFCISLTSIGNCLWHLFRLQYSDCCLVT